jgi:ABC-type phosphate transport system substrate-binding protein
VKRASSAIVLTLALLMPRLSASGDPTGVAQRSDTLVMVANKNNAAAAKMNKIEARKLLLGQTTSWPDGGKVTIVLRAMGSSDRTSVLQKVCGMSEAEYTRHNLQATFMGETVASVVEAPSPAAIRNFIRSNPGAVGFLRESEVEEGVKTVWPVE